MSTMCITIYYLTLSSGISAFCKLRLFKSLKLLFAVYVSNTDCNAIYHVAD